MAKTSGDASGPVAGGSATRPISAFVSWAHAHDSWTAQQGAEWQKTVLYFATALRQIGGIDADLDLWHQTSHENWSTFGVSGIQNSDFVLIAVSKAYCERWEETGSLAVGAGAAREANAIKGIFERDRAEFQRRVKVILLPGATVDDIPLELLGGTERFRIPSFDLSGLVGLFRSLHGRPEFAPPPLGAVPTLPSHYVDAQEQGHPEEELRRRLDEINRHLGDSPSAPAEPVLAYYERGELLETRQVVENSLEALHHLSSATTSAEERQAPPSQLDELAQAISTAKDAIAAAQQAVNSIPPIAREALFQYFHNAQPLTVGGTHDGFALQDAIRGAEDGYVNWVEDLDQAVTARRANPRVAAALSALKLVRRHVFGGVSTETRARAAPWARILLDKEYGVEDPEFELRPVWAELRFLAK